MRRVAALFALVTLTLAALTLGLVGCAGSGEEEAAPAAGSEELAWVRENVPVLEAKRAELQEIRDRIAGKVPEGEAVEGEEEGGEAEPPLTPEQLEMKAQTLDNEIIDISNEITQRAVNYLNESGIVVGGELTEDQRYVVDVKIDEDILVAQEYIDKGGDYSRALDIYRGSLQMDPENEKLLAKLAEGEERRYMSEERFAAAKKGMTEDEVRAAIGQVKLSNLKEYENGVTTWYYRKNDGGAAAVFFQEKGGQLKVYKIDYNAIEQEIR